MSNTTLSKAKEAYIKPEMSTIDMGPIVSVLNDISNPGGTVPPIDPEEGQCTMKSINGFLVGVISLLALMVSCIAEPEVQEVDITTVHCSIPQIDVEEDFATGILDTLADTKATFSGTYFLWSTGDKIGIVPNTGAQIYFEVDDGAGTSTASFDGGDWAMKSTGTFYAYYPLYPDIFLSKDHVPVSYTGQAQNGNNNNLHTGNFWSLYTEGTTAVGNTLNFSFNHLTSFFKTYVTVPAGTYTKITFSAPSEVFIKDGYFDLSAQIPAIVGTTFTDELCLDLQNITFAEETELTGYLVVAPVNITGVPIAITVYKDGVPAYEYTLIKDSPMIAAKTYAFRATSITQLAASVAQANTLFASGAASVSITEPLTEDAAIVLPNTSEAVVLTLPTTASTSTLTVSYPQNASAYPATLSIAGPEGSHLDIRTPNSTVTINGVSYDQITSRTAANTCIIPAGVTVNNLKVVQGGVQVYGTVTQIDLSEQEDDAIIFVSGSVASLLGEDDEEYVPATGVTLSQSSISLNVGATETLTATVAPVGAYPKVVWSSSDDAVATVSTNGVVTAVAEGTATITATTIFGGFTATCTITITDSSRPESALPGVFSVGLNSKVYFSKGNLQYTRGTTSSNGTWGFAENQYDIVGNTNSNCLQGGSAGDKVDLFCWSADHYQNYGLTSQTASSYFDGLFLEWGALIDADETWRTLSMEEWRYVLGTSSERLGKYKNWVCVNGIYGLIIAPDDYSGTIADTYDATAWTAAENDGLVFLPISGYRYGNAIISLTDYGYYWSSTTANQYNQYAGSVYICSEYFGVGDGVLRRNAGLVRLVSECSDFTPTPNPTVQNGHEYIDLGLPSGLKWSTTNIGATSPKGVGDKFAWGETSPKAEYTWNNYKYGGYNPDDNDYHWMYKYCTKEIAGNVDGKTVLELGDDAAYVNWGESWRMPRIHEFEELRTNCTWIWTTIIGGTKGYIVIGQNGNRFFLPLTGETDYFGNAAGVYWSSDLEASSWDDAARSLQFNSSWHTTGTGTSYDRAYGECIRPVIRAVSDI